jgi:hypothetical protein
VACTVPETPTLCAELVAVTGGTDSHKGQDKEGSGMRSGVYPGWSRPRPRLSLAKHRSYSPAASVPEKGQPVSCRPPQRCHGVPQLSKSSAHP